MPGPRPPSRLFSTSLSRTAQRPRFSRGGESQDVMDIGSIPAFDNAALTRATHLKLDKQRDFLHLLRVEQLQFGNLSASNPRFLASLCAPASVYFQLILFSAFSSTAAHSQKFLKPLPSQMIKVKHQHYQGEDHPASLKVSITFSPSDLPFSSETTRRKFRLLVGNRWDMDKDSVKISCELFPNRNMNEKWCSDVLDKLMKEAEDSTDPMLDIPLDPRPTQSRLRKSHKKPQVTFKNSFPSEWLPTRKETSREVVGGEQGTGAFEGTRSGVGSQGGLTDAVAT